MTSVRRASLLTTLSAAGVKNSGTSSQNLEAGLEVVNASVIAVGIPLPLHYLSLLFATCKQEKKEKEKRNQLNVNINIYLRKIITFSKVKNCSVRRMA